MNSHLINCLSMNCNSLNSHSMNGMSLYEISFDCQSTNCHSIKCLRALQSEASKFSDTFGSRPSCFTFLPEFSSAKSSEISTLTDFCKTVSIPAWT